MLPGSGRKLASEWCDVVVFGGKVKCHEVINKKAPRIKQHLLK